MTSDQAFRNAARARDQAKRCAAGLREDLLSQIRRATELFARLDAPDEALCADLTAHFSLSPTLAADIAALAGNLADVERWYDEADRLDDEQEAVIASWGAP